MLLTAVFIHEIIICTTENYSADKVKDGTVLNEYYQSQSSLEQQQRRMNTTSVDTDCITAG